MNRKVLLILADGMRADALAACGNPFVDEFLRESAYTLRARTVMPSVTLPCHMSLFHSVTPQRHGILSNTYTPQVRYVAGLFDHLCEAGKRCAFFYDWEELRDLSRPGAVEYSQYMHGHRLPSEQTMRRNAESAVAYIQECAPDFVFLYFGHPDTTGHDRGWMSPEYKRAVYDVWSHIRQIVAALPEEYAVIVTADHGGHDRIHGLELDEDMTIPFVLHGAGIPAGEIGGDVNIIDIAPTIVKLLGVDAYEDWDGKSLL